MPFLIERSEFPDYNIVVAFPLILDDYHTAMELRSQLVPHIPELFRLYNLSGDSCALEIGFELGESFVRMPFLSYLYVVEEVPGLFRLVTGEVIQS